MFRPCSAKRTLFYFANSHVVLVEKFQGSINLLSTSANAIQDKIKLSTSGVAQSKVNVTLKMQELKINKSFKFSDYDCIGFDLDNTVCRYKVSNMVEMEYECLKNFLIEKRNYNGKYLNRPIKENVDFMIKGLILDVKKGNVLRISPEGHILHGSHGTKELTRSEIIEYYGNPPTWEITDRFKQNPLSTWNGPPAEDMRTLSDYFDMPAGLIFARAVDTLDEENGGKLDKYNIYPDVTAGLQEMFHKGHFELDKGGYFPKIKSDPDNYIHACSPKLMDWFRTLKSQNKILFLITGSNIDFASHTALNSMGAEWRELFDIVICFAKKPGFFTEKRPFIAVDGIVETHEVPCNQIERNKIYTYGNWSGLYQFLRKISNNNDPRIVYVGDNLIQDVYTPAVHTVCDTVAVCEELEAEGIFGHDKTHFDKSFLESNIWGSYFHHLVETNPTIWKHMIQEHAKLCIPSLEFVAEFPTDFEFCSF